MAHKGGTPAGVEVALAGLEKLLQHCLARGGIRQSGVGAEIRAVGVEGGAQREHGGRSGAVGFRQSGEELFCPGGIVARQARGQLDQQIAVHGAVVHHAAEHGQRLCKVRAQIAFPIVHRSACVAEAAVIEASHEFLRVLRPEGGRLAQQLRAFRFREFRPANDGEHPLRGAIADLIAQLAQESLPRFAGQCSHESHDLPGLSMCREMPGERPLHPRAFGFTERGKLREGRGGIAVHLKGRERFQSAVLRSTAVRQRCQHARQPIRRERRDIRRHVAQCEVIAKAAARQPCAGRRGIALEPHPVSPRSLKGDLAVFFQKGHRRSGVGFRGGGQQRGGISAGEKRGGMERRAQVFARQ